MIYLKDIPYCPRCGGQWLADSMDNYDLICNNCYSILLRNDPWNGNEPDITQYHVYDIIKKNDELIWFFNIQKCCYGKTVLSWLPFDITADKLKTYLLIS